MDEVKTTLAGSSEAAVKSDELRVTADNWNEAQTLTITGADDEDTADEQSILTLSSMGLSDVIITVDVTDPDELTVVGGPSSLNVREGATVTASFSLSYRPRDTVTINIDSDDVDAIRPQPGRLAFTPNNYATPQMVLFSGVEDDDVADESTTVRLTGAGAEVTIPATVTDDDQLGLVATPSTLMVSESGMGTFMVRLTHQPSADVAVTVLSSDTQVATAAPAVVTFTPVNWDQPQTVTVAGVSDADLADDMATISVSATGVPAASVAVLVSDDDRQGFILDRTQLMITEGQSETISVNLRFAPPSAVMVSLASGDSTVAQVMPTTLTFTPTNYNVPQQVTVSAQEDPDLTSEMTTVTVSAAGLTPAMVSVSVTDDDQQALVFSPSTVMVGEGANASLQVSLQFAPSSPVRVIATNSNPAALSFFPTAGLTFSPGNYNQPQVLTLSAPQDLNTTDETATLTLIAPGAPDGTVNVNVLDDDTQRMVVTPLSVTVAEGGTSQVSVSLAYAPTAPVVVAAASSAPGAATVSPATLTFTPTNYATPQTLTVAGVPDNDVTNEAASIALLSAGLPPVNVGVLVTDDDTQGIILSSNTLTVAEGSTNFFTVRLQYDPGTNATVTLNSSDLTAASLLPASVVFTSSNYQIPQTVSVTGVQDDDVSDESVTISVASVIAPTSVVSVSVTDDDTQSVVTAASTNVTEGSTTNLNVALRYRPSSVTTLLITPQDSTLLAVSPSVLTFTPTNYNQVQQVQIRALEDVDVANNTSSIMIAGAGMSTVFVTITDDDVQSLMVSPSSVSLLEGGSGTVGVRLSYQPAAATTVVFASQDPSAVTVNTSALTFTPANYDAVQTVTLTGVQDTDTVDDTTTLRVSSFGITTVSVPVTVTDDDLLNLQVTPSSLSLQEGGASGQVSVVLTQQPASDVTVGIMSTDVGAADASLWTLVFTPSNWSVPQTFDVTAASDLDTRNENISILVGAAGLASRTVSVAVTDDDVQALQLSQTNLTVNEGGTGTFNVRLAFDPGADTTVTVNASDTGAGTVSPTSLLFTAANYALPQTVVVSGVQDLDVSNEALTVNVSSGALPTRSVAVTVNDDDVQSLQVSQTTVAVTEGGSGSFTVRLGFDPGASTTVMLASTDPGGRHRQPEYADV